MKDDLKWILVNIDPIMIQHKYVLKTFTAKDFNPTSYNSWKRMIEKYNFQIGDDLKVCLWNALNGITPIRPEQTEEQKNMKPRGMFAT